MKSGLFGVVICATLASVACGDQQDAKSATGGATLSSGTLASDFSAQDTNGATLHLSDYLGKDVILLDFWATWCQPCLEEMPHLRRIYEANKSRGFVVIGISMDGPETVAEVPSFAQRNRLAFPIVLDQDSHVASVYNPRKSAPLSVLIDKTGKVIMVHEGYNPGDETSIAAEIEKALSAPAGAAPVAAPPPANATAQSPSNPVPPSPASTMAPPPSPAPASPLPAPKS